MVSRQKTAIERVHQATVALADGGNLLTLSRRLVESVRTLLCCRAAHLYLEDDENRLTLFASAAAVGTEIAPPSLALAVDKAGEASALGEAFGREIDGFQILAHGGLPIGVVLWTDGETEKSEVPVSLLEGCLKVAAALLAARLEVKTAFEESERDPNTGLYSNGHYDARLIEEVSRAVRHERPVSLIVLAIDDFEAHREALASTIVEASVLRLAGLLVGDEPEVLHARDGDVAARLETSSFALLLPDTPKKGALIKAERVRASIAGSLQGSGESAITVSIGVAAFPEDAMDAPGLHEAACKALAYAGAAGGNQVGQA